MFVFLLFSQSKPGSSLTEANNVVEGKEFVFAIPRPYSNDQASPIRFGFSTSGQSPVLVNIKVPADDFDETTTIIPTASAIFELVDGADNPVGYSDDETTLVHKYTIIITATEDITVHGITQYQASGFRQAGFTALPTPSLGTSYFVASYTPYEADKEAQFAVSALNERTTITFARKDGVSGTVVLEPYETYQHYSLTDLTGTEIKSDKRIAVVSGLQVAKIPVDGTTNSVDNILEQLIPVCAWGHGPFVLAPINYRSDVAYLYRVIASKADTRVTISDGETITLTDPGDYVERDVASNSEDARTVTADKPVMVLQYLKSGVTGQGYTDPEMIMIPELGQYMGDVSFPIIDNSDGAVTYTQYISVFLECRFRSGLMYDRTTEVSTSGDWTEVTTPDGEFCIIRSNNGIVTGDTLIHTFSHPDPTAKFLVLISGFIWVRSHTHVAGFTFNGKCSAGKLKQYRVMLKPYDFL